MYIMDNFSNEDILMFINSYNENLIKGVVKSVKIPVYVEYLTLKYQYRKNGIDEDVFFKKRFQITTDDLVTIHKLIERLKEGKTLNQTKKINASGISNNMSNFATFNEDEQVVEGKFEILSQVQGAMDDYHKKMKKLQKKKVDWKKVNDYNFQNNNNYDSHMSNSDIYHKLNTMNDEINYKNNYTNDNNYINNNNNYANNNNNYANNNNNYVNNNNYANNNNYTNGNYQNVNNVNIEYPNVSYGKKNDEILFKQTNDRFFQDVNVKKQFGDGNENLPVKYFNENSNNFNNSNISYVTGEQTRQDNRSYMR